MWDNATVQNYFSTVTYSNIFLYSILLQTNRNHQPPTTSDTTWLTFASLLRFWCTKRTYNVKNFQSEIIWTLWIQYVRSSVCAYRKPSCFEYSTTQMTQCHVQVVKSNSLLGQPPSSHAFMNRSSSLSRCVCNVVAMQSVVFKLAHSTRRSLLTTMMLLFPEIV